MIFTSSKCDTTWDTWLYADQEMYYLYYLIARNRRWEGFGVAVSRDGVTFQDLGEQLSASEKMSNYFGTGAVWKSLTDPDLFICNFSEWRELEGGLSQQIYFAYSKDLIHWDKFGDDHCFAVDPQHYRVYQNDHARWDCIYPLRYDSGYFGVWTATPHNGYGFGIGYSADGLTWNALPPPVIQPSEFDGLPLEAGAITRHEDKYYLMLGCYSHPLGMGIFTSNTLEGPFMPQSKSFALFANQDKMNAYFARFLERPDETLVNFHVLLNEKSANGQPKTYLAPLKKADYDKHGTLRLKWWNGNDKLIGDECADFCDPCIITMQAKAGSLMILNDQEGKTYHIRLMEYGRIEIWQDDILMVYAERDLEEDMISGEMHVLLRNVMLEVYWKEWFMIYYTLSSPIIRAESVDELKYHDLNIV